MACAITTSGFSFPTRCQQLSPTANIPQIKVARTPEGRVKVAVSSLTAIELEVAVPTTSKLNLLCDNCAIMVAKARARTTDGSIAFTGIHSPQVEANSTTGNVKFSGGILRSGSYTSKSFSGHVDATLPANADFIFAAYSFRVAVDIEGFALRFGKQTAEITEVIVGER